MAEGKTGTAKLEGREFPLGGLYHEIIRLYHAGKGLERDTGNGNGYTSDGRHPHHTGYGFLQFDLKDFVHSISAQRIKEMFMAMPFDYPEDTAQ